MGLPRSFWFGFYSLLVVCAGVGACAQDTVGDLYASDASVKGSVILTTGGTRVMSGSSVSAGDVPALLKLARGGEVRVCPRTSISVSTSPSGRDLMVGLGEGAIEAQYSLLASADSILTPDFRVLLAGPGSFHLAIGLDARGNTCMRTLSGNTSSVIVSELMGDGSYQVRPGETVSFHGGRVTPAETAFSGECGCPVAAVPVMRAVIPAAPRPAEPPPPSPAIGEVHVQVDAPFIFSAADLLAPPVAVADLRLSRSLDIPLSVLPPEIVSAQAAPEVQAAPPPAQKKPEKRGLFRKVRAFFAAIFH